MNKSIAQLSYVKDLSYSTRDKAYNIIRTNAMLKGIFLIGTGSLLAQIAKVVSMPIITRLYGPQNYGLFAVYLSLFSIVTIIASLKYELAIPVAKDEKVASNLFNLCLLLVAATSVCIMLSLALFGDSLLLLLGASELKPYLWLFIPAFFIIGVFNIFIYWTIRRRNYGIITYTKVYQSFGGVISKIALGFLPLGPLGLIIGDFISNICGVGKVISKAWREDRDILRRGPIKAILDTAVEYRRFPLYTCSSAVISQITLQVPVLLISSMYGLKEAGYYSLATSILFLPASIIGDGINQVYLGEVTELMRNNKYKVLESLFLSTTSKLALIAIPLIGAIAVVAPIIFPIVFGSKWLNVGVYCLPISVVAISYFIIAPTSNIEISGFNHWELIWNVFRTVAIIGCFFIGYQMKTSIMSALWVYVSVMVLAYFIYFLMNIKAIRKIQS